MTVVTMTNGVLVPGQLINSSGVAAGTYIVSQLTNTDTHVGGTGTYLLSTSPGTISGPQVATASAWIETAFSCESAAGAGELVKVGRSL
jgi:hypothetical protein